MKPKPPSYPVWSTGYSGTISLDVIDKLKEPCEGRAAADSRPFPSHCFYISPRPVTPAGVTFKEDHNADRIRP